MDLRFCARCPDARIKKLPKPVGPFTADLWCTVCKGWCRDVVESYPHSPKQCEPVLRVKSRPK